MATSGRSFNAGLFWVNQNDFDSAGDLVDFHKHKQPHATGVKYGEFDVTLKWPDGREENYPVTQFDQPIHVPALVEHRIICTKAPGRTDCMFLHYTPFGEITDRYMGVTFKRPADDEHPADNPG